MGLIKHFNDLPPYLMTFEEALGTSRFQEHPLHPLAARAAWGLPGTGETGENPSSWHFGWRKVCGSSARVFLAFSRGLD